MAYEVGVQVPVVVEYASADIEALSRDPQGLRDLLEDLCRRLAQAALYLAQIRVRDPRYLRHPAERESRHLPLGADELTQVRPAVRKVSQREPPSGLAVHLSPPAP